MSDAIHSASSRHKQAAAEHEIAALQHRTAAEFHDKRMLHAARRYSEDARECCIKAYTQSVLACEHSEIEEPRTKPARALGIRRILDARFSLSALEESRNTDPRWWNSERNDMGRGIYGEALRELRRLEDATEGEVDAELAAIARQETFARFS
jgi:hypothetical protein